MNKILKNWLYLLFSDISVQGIGFIVMIVLAKRLSPEGYGQFNVVLSIVALFTVFSNSGMNIVLLREVTLFQKSTKKIFSLIIPIRIVSFFFATIALLIYIQLKNYDDSSIYLFAIILVLNNSLWDISESIAFGHLVTKYSTIFNLIFSSSWLFVVIFLPENIFNIKIVVAIYSIILFLRGSAYLWTVFKKHVKINNEAIKLTWKSIVFMSIPYIWLRSLGVFADQIPILMLNDNSGPAEVGYFSVGARLIIPITLAIGTGLRAMFPFLTQLFNKDIDLFRKRIIEGFNFIIVVGPLIATVLVLTSNYWIILFFGKGYANAIPVFNIMAWFGVLLSFDLLLSTGLSSTYNQKTLAIITTIDFIILFPIYYFGAKYGALGFATAKLIGTTIAVFYHLFVFKKVLGVKLNFNEMLIGFLFFLLLFASVTYIDDIIIKLFLVLSVILSFAFIKNSPLQHNIVLLKSIIQKMDKNN